MSGHKESRSEPLISVIIPVYNTADYLEKAVNSVLRQTYRNLEVFLVDDGSTDESGEICDTFAAADDRVRVLHTENGGISRARNTAMDLISGELVAFVDSDDILAPVMYSALAECLRRNPEADIAECGFLSIHPDRTEKYTTSTGRIRLFRPMDAICSQMTWGEFKSVIWNKLYKRHTVENVRFPLGRIHEDEFTTWKFFRNADQIALLDVDLYIYNCLRANDTIRTRRDNRLDQVVASGELLDYIISHGDSRYVEIAVLEHCHRMKRTIIECHRGGFQTERYYRALRQAKEFYEAAKYKWAYILPEYEDFFTHLDDMR